MRLKTWAAAASLLALAGGGPAFGFLNNTGGGTAQFLEMGAGARALGMGEAFGAIAEGPQGVYWNPAGLGQIKNPELGYSQTEFLRFFHHQHAAYAHPVEKFQGAFSISLTNYYQDELPILNNANQNLGSFSPNGQVFSLAFGRRFLNEGSGNSKVKDYFGNTWNIPGMVRPLDMDEHEPWRGTVMVGLAFKVIREEIFEFKASAVALDGGFIYRPAAVMGLSTSFAFRNAGSRLQFQNESEALPAEIEASSAYEMALGDARLLSAAALTIPYYGPLFGKFGLEYRQPITKKMTAILRGGYKTQTAAFEAMSGATWGLGVVYGAFSIDIAFQPQDEFGEIYRLGMDYHW